jgi:hypothetical protein
MLGPEEINYFTNRRTTAANQAGRGLARNTFNRGQAELRASMARSNLARQYRPARERIQQNAAIRGLSSSGFYRRGLGELLSDRMRGLQDIEMGLQGQLGNLRFEQEDIEQGLADTRAQVDAEELMRRVLAAQIRGAQ